MNIKIFATLLSASALLMATPAQADWWEVDTNDNELPAETSYNGYGGEHDYNDDHDGWGGDYGNGHGHGGSHNYGNGDNQPFGDLESGFVDFYSGAVRQGQAGATFHALDSQGDSSDHVEGQSATLSEGEAEAGGVTNFSYGGSDSGGSISLWANARQFDASAAQAMRDKPGQVFSGTVSTSAVAGGFGWGNGECAGGCPAGGDDD